MGKFLSLAALLGLLVLPEGGLAAEDSTAAQSTAASTPSTETQESGAALLLGQVLLRPSAGEIFFDENDSFASGVLAELPVLRASDFTLAIASGFLYSDLGNSVTENTASSAYSLFQIPVDLKLAIQPKRIPALRVGPHVGLNLIRSPGGLNAPFGSSGMVSMAQPFAPAASASWDTYPDVGGDVDYALTPKIDLGLRYDSTLMSAFNLQTLTLGVGITI